MLNSLAAKSRDGWVMTGIEKMIVALRIGGNRLVDIAEIMNKTPANISMRLVVLRRKFTKEACI